MMRRYYLEEQGSGILITDIKELDMANDSFSGTDRFLAADWIVVEVHKLQVILQNIRFPLRRSARLDLLNAVLQLRNMRFLVDDMELHGHIQCQVGATLKNVHSTLTDALTRIPE